MNPETLFQRFFTEKDIARLLGLKPQTLRRWRQEGRGPRPTKFGRAVRYDLAEVEAWFDRRRASTSDADSRRA